MNTFYEHHHDSIRFGYRCCDRILINGLIQPFQQPERVVGFFNTYRQQYPVSRAVLTDIATQYQRWVIAHAKTWGAPIVESPAGRRDAFVEPYFHRAKPDQVVVIVKGREPARILTAIGKDDRWHLQYARRWVIQYNFYLQDRDWGRVFVRLCPYFPFSARVCLNQHHWLATRLRAEGIRFRQESNAFLTCSDPDTIVAAFDAGATAEEIAQQYSSISLADVYSVITYYLRHKTEVSAYLHRRQEQAATVREEVERRFPPSDIRERLIARRR